MKQKTQTVICPYCGEDFRRKGERTVHLPGVRIRGVNLGGHQIKLH